VIGAGACGAVVAGFAALESRIAWRPGTLMLPWGGLLAVGASVAVVLVARTVGRGAGLAAAAGWILGTGLILGGRPEGDYVFAQDTLGLGYLLICTVLVISAAAGGAGR
jgi:hypothetical protein